MVFGDGNLNNNIMEIREFKCSKTNWDCTEIKCEKTGVAIRKYIGEDKSVEYQLFGDADSSGEVISENNFEIIKTMLI